MAQADNPNNSAASPPGLKPAPAGWPTLAWSVLAAIGLTLVSVTVFTPRYETNDDVTMQLLASGLVFADRPDEHLLYSNVLVGLVLKHLYSGLPSIPWYGLYQVGTLTISAAALTFVLLSVGRSPRRMAVVAIVLTVAVLPCLVEIQFTKTAFLASFAGLLLLLLPLRASTPRPVITDAVGGALLVWGSLIRYESFLLALLVAVPLAAAGIAFDRRKAAWRLVPMLVAAVAAIGLQQYNRFYYARDEGWRNFYEYNALRAEFTDYNRFPYTPDMDPILNTVGWTPIDLKMMNNWFFANRERFGLDNVRRLAAILPPAKRPSFEHEAREEVLNLFSSPLMMRLLLAVPCLLLLVLADWRSWLLAAVLLLTAFGLTVAMRSLFWFPFRAAFSLYTGVLTGTALFTTTATDRVLRTAFASRTVRMLGGAFAAGLIVWSLFGPVERDQERSRLHEQATRLVRELNPQPDQLFVTWREHFPFEELVAPLGDASNLRNFRCVALSALLPTPITERQIEHFGIANLDRAISERPDVFLVTLPAYVVVYCYYMQVHYESAPEFRVTFTRPGPLHCCVFRSESAPTSRRQGPP
jgi:hypothetical protein